MTSTHSGNDAEMQEAFAEKVKNMVGIIRKNIQNHGGDIELVSIDENNSVKVRLRCESRRCPEAQKVFEATVRQLLKQKIPEVKEVVVVD